MFQPQHVQMRKLRKSVEAANQSAEELAQQRRQQAGPTDEDAYEQLDAAFEAAYTQLGANYLMQRLETYISILEDRG